MIAKIAKRGTSLKGAALYYLHDKKREGEKERLTDDRVAWTATRNIMTDDPEKAFRYMLFTALDKDRLKEQAGITSAGRKSKGDVYTYSLAWHPDEQGKFDKSQMMDAVDQSLKALGAHNHQAVVVAHQDEDHPHVHVILNMVNPENGKNLVVSNDRKKLHKWANDYRRSRGEDHKYCPNRAKKFDALDARKEGQKLPYMRGKKETPRQLHDLFKQAKSNSANDNELEDVKTREAKLDAQLVRDSQVQKSRHSHQWDALSDNYKLRKSGIWKRYKSENKDARDAVFQQMKPAFTELYRQQGIERSEFAKRETRLSGKLKNVKDAIIHIASVREDKNEHIAGMVFNFFSGKGSREAWLLDKQKREVDALKREQRYRMKDATAKCVDLRKVRSKSALQDFKLERSALMGKQKSEKEELKYRWKVRTSSKKKAVEAVISKAKVQHREEPTVVQAEKNTTRERFKERSNQSSQEKPERAKRKRKPRSRARKRDRDD